MKKRKILSLLQSLVLLFACFPSQIVQAEEESADVDVWDGTTDTSWYDAEEKEVHICTAEQFAGLQALSEKGVTFDGCTFYLEIDLDLKGHNWTPIKNFYGDFEGKEHCIRNLQVDCECTESDSSLYDSYYFSRKEPKLTDRKNIGVFGISEGHIRNLSVTDAAVNVQCIYIVSAETIIKNSVLEYYARHIYFTGILCGISCGSIENCNVEGTITLSNCIRFNLTNLPSVSEDQKNITGTVYTMNNYFVGGICGSNCGGGLARSKSNVKIRMEDGSDTLRLNKANTQHRNEYGEIVHDQIELNAVAGNSGVRCIGGMTGLSGEIFTGEPAVSSSAYLSLTKDLWLNSSSLNGSGRKIGGSSSGIFGISECQSTVSYIDSPNINHSLEHIGGITGLSSDGQSISSCSAFLTLGGDPNYDKTGGHIIGGICGGCAEKNMEIKQCYAVTENAMPENSLAQLACSGILGSIIGKDEANYIHSSSEPAVSISNVYCVGKTDYAIVPQGGDKTKVESCYYLNTNVSAEQYGANRQAIAKTENNMKEREFAEALGYPFVYAEGDYPKLECEFQEFGDVNIDGRVTIADAVAFQKYLLTEVRFDSKSANNGDMDRNRILNAVDFTLLKRKLINQ